VISEQKYVHLAFSDGVAHLERLPRIRVSQIVSDYLAHGWSVDEICRNYPHLRPAEVHSAFAYYFDNVDVVEAEIKRELDDANAAAEAPPSSLRRRLKKAKSS
jgi:hypothetical protein